MFRSLSFHLPLPRSLSYTRLPQSSSVWIVTSTISRELYRCLDLFVLKRRQFDRIECKVLDCNLVQRGFDNADQVYDGSRLITPPSEHYDWSNLT